MVRTSKDIIDSVLRRCGEPNDGTSLYQQQAIDYVQQIHHTIITGGSEFNLEVDEPWVWARARRPLILEIQPLYNSGSVTLTQGSVSGTFSVAPTVSMQDNFLVLDSGPERYQIISHVANATSFQIDAAFPQTSVVGQTFKAYLLDYDLVGSYIVIDAFNNTLDFSVDGAATLSATVAAGSYTPAALATAVAAALHAADSARIYSGSYDSVTRYFTFTSDRATAAKFILKGDSANYYKSLWPTLGFDYVTVADAASQTSSYPHSSVMRMTEPGRSYYGAFFNYGQYKGIVSGIDPLAFDQQFPLAGTKMGTPTVFTVIGEKPDGTQRVRFNKYPSQKMRIEFEHIPYPKDIQYSDASIPLIPQKFSRALEYGASFYVLTDKRDQKAQSYFQIAQQTLQAMLKFNRKELERVGLNYGNVIARADLMPDKRRNRRNDYGYAVEDI